MGDPRGIGPEIIAKACCDRSIKRMGRLVVIGDGRSMERAAKALKAKSRAKKLSFEILDLGAEDPDTDPLRYIDAAADLIKRGLAGAMATAPVNKEAITRAGVKFVGHTEYLAGLTRSKDIAMMFAGGDFKVTVVTRHIPLAKVSASLTRKDIETTARLTYEFVKGPCGVRRPKIGVLALNPHAGEGGKIGRDEKATIKPAVTRLRRSLSTVYGPLPADSAFGQMLSGRYDALVAMYHDQAMIPVKTFAREKCVNITLGLPFVRTSPVHGTAYDIAGKGIADPSSMKESIKMACRLCSQKKR
jgi:4-hydroxythreonine-4-phosphate dehydrogenase